MIGHLLDGRYQIIEVLGAGGFGHTYIAEDTRIPGQPRCVVKQLRPERPDPTMLPTARRLFQREAETLAFLGQHEQIPRLLAYFEENQEFYLVQELVTGNPLSEELRPGKTFNEAYVLKLCTEVLPVLAFIHQQDVIHRDIKPDNLIRRESDGKIVLIDFGAVKQIRKSLAVGEDSVTVSIGTPGYMATEQAKGKPRQNSDIYALGMICIQALKGLYPRELEEDQNTGEVIWQDGVKVSPGLIEVINGMVRYHFKDRYQNAKEVIEALRLLPQASYSPRIPVTATAPMASSPLYELTLEWVEAGLQKSQVIREGQPSKEPGCFRIGRDYSKCDLVLTDPTVSGLQAEIFFHHQQQRFYLRCLRESNPPLIDGQPLTQGEMALTPGNHLSFGAINLRVTSIIARESAPGVNYPSTVATATNKQYSQPPQPIAPTVPPAQAHRGEGTFAPTNNTVPITTSGGTQIPQGEEKTLAFLSPRTINLEGEQQRNTLVTHTNTQANSQPPSITASGQGKTVLLLTASFMALAIAVVTVLAPDLIRSRDNSNPPSNAAVKASPSPEEKQQTESEKCFLLSPSVRGGIVKVYSQPRRNAYTGKNLEKGTKVSFVKEQGAFVLVEQQNGQQGWVFNDQIQPCQ